MKKIAILIAVIAATVFVWNSQRPHLAVIRAQNERLADVASELKQRAERADAAKQAAEARLAKLRDDLKARREVVAEFKRQDQGRQPPPPPDPDPTRSGGWPTDAAFFYLPKQYLTNASYQLLNGGRLTDEAAALLGMSPAERESTDKAFTDLLDQFRRLEIQRMEPIAAPAGWMVGAGQQPGAPSAMSFDSSLTYRIPDLSQDIGTAQKAFVDQLQQGLGASRADIVSSAANSFLRQNLDDLGTGDRIVGFVWQPESDGSHSLWYANADALRGEGAFQRVDESLDPNSQTAYYARLFGVKLPGH
jgi:hypothetical protein